MCVIRKIQEMTKKYILTFPVDATDRSVTYELIKKFDIRINILKAEIEIGKSGQLLVELEANEEQLERGIKYLKESGIIVSALANKISHDEEKCINCGNCASACFSGALTIKAPDWKLKFDPAKCIICKLCLKSCPLKLFKIEFAEQ